MTTNAWRRRCHLSGASKNHLIVFGCLCTIQFIHWQKHSYNASHRPHLTRTYTSDFVVSQSHTFYCIFILFYVRWLWKRKTSKIVANTVLLRKKRRNEMNISSVAYTHFMNTENEQNKTKKHTHIQMRQFLSNFWYDTMMILNFILYCNNK